MVSAYSRPANNHLYNRFPSRILGPVPGNWHPEYLMFDSIEMKVARPVNFIYDKVRLYPIEDL